MEFLTMRNIFNVGQRDAHFVHCASPRHGVRSKSLILPPPVCARFACLDWGYEEFSLSEAVPPAIQKNNGIIESPRLFHFRGCFPANQKNNGIEGSLPFPSLRLQVSSSKCPPAGTMNQKV